MSELKELVGFLHDENPQVRMLALQHLLPFTMRTNPHFDIFREDDYRPVKQLKALLVDKPQIASQAATALVNVSQNHEVRRYLIDAEFVQTVLGIITNPEHGLADLCCMLLCNLTKEDDIVNMFDMKVPLREYSLSSNAIDQLMDCFVKGSNHGINQYANYDFLANVFADLTRFERGRKYFTEAQAYDDVIPISKVVVFTDHASVLRRTGVAATIKNVCFDTTFHASLMDEDGINVLPYLLLPLAGPEELSDEDMDGMFDELQLLPDDKKREPDLFVMKTHVESLILLTATREGREHMRLRKVYPIIRELHLAVEDEDIRALCDQLVQMLVRDEEPVVVEEDEDDVLVEID
ncbi:eukaryotic protein [Schizosaccharomyces japonicus yFS275]|uniref:Protein HGH1 homolog n=1 Tax=Schizosaccharomyces japonicus (strain yFS275 / FY16936) TaxID=402676 RepID=B6JZH4_SCHJY|nr:eukaryotic protein [Schizosaccharomyces japonicus yFS275]EEB06942.2 eukaryotic protein [Schizosaccharomyces japonicus yFS275]